MKKILYVDDASSMRKLVDMVLGKDFALTMAEDGLEALKKVENEQFDVIISDVNMPNMNGIDFLIEARKLNSYKFTPILMMTTEASPEMKAKGKEGGATGWIVKPFDPQKLPNIVNKVL